MEQVSDPLADYRKGMQKNLAEAEAKLIEIQGSAVFSQSYKDKSTTLYEWAIANHKNELAGFDNLYGKYLQ